MLSNDISLRALEVFVSIARTGSIAKTAGDLSLSVASVSQQLKSLEDSLGRPLLDHSRRPMVLTPAGRSFVQRAEQGLMDIARGWAEAQVPELRQLTSLRLGVIDDFDTSITPDLTTILAERISDCAFRLHSRPSHELCRLVSEGALDIAVAAMPEEGLPGAIEVPILQDPFVLILPAGASFDGKSWESLPQDLEFLRFDREQRIGARIEAELRRLGLDFPNRYELDANPSLNALVASGRCFAVSTVLSWLQAERFHDKISVHPLPGASFARTISIVAAPSFPRDALAGITSTLRQLVQTQALDTALQRHPWLAGAFRLMDEVRP